MSPFVMLPLPAPFQKGCHFWFCAGCLLDIDRLVTDTDLQTAMFNEEP